MMLIHVDQDRALDYLSTCIDQIHSFGDILQLVIVELVYKVCIKGAGGADCRAGIQGVYKEGRGC